MDARPLGVRRIAISSPARYAPPAIIWPSGTAMAGKHWPTKLPHLIGKCRTQVWEYANKKREVPQTVNLLMEQFAK